MLLQLLLLQVLPCHSTTIDIVANEVVGGGSVQTVAELQALLDGHPNTVFRVRSSSWQIDAAAPKSIWLRDNRTLLMDSQTVIENPAGALLPSTYVQKAGGEAITGYGALLTVSGNNIGVVGGRFHQQPQNLTCTWGKPACNFAIDIFRSSGVKLRDSVVQGSFGSSVRIQESFGTGVTPGHPPVAMHWSTLPGLARQPVFITNVTLLHHSNASFYQVRGFWTVTAQNVIFTRNRIIGEFMYSIDLDSSSSGNLVHNNYYA